MNPEEAATQTLDLAATPTGAFIKDGTVTDVTGNNATVSVDGGGDARPAILGFIPAVGDRVTMLFDPAANGTCVILGTLGGTVPIALADVYPVGAVVIFYDSADPADTFGFGTWVQIATGEALVGIGSAPFDAVGSIGAAGEETVTLTASEMPGHTHTGPSHTHTGPSHTHTGPSHAHTGPTGSWLHYVTSGGSRADGGSGTGYDRDTLGSTGTAGTGDTGASGTGATSAAGTGASGSTGGDNPHNNIQPSFVVYVWRRTV